MQAKLEGRVLHLRNADVLTTAAGPVRLANDRFDGKFRTLREPPEGGHCKFRRTTKNDAQRGHRSERELPVAGFPQFADPAFN